VRGLDRPIFIVGCPRSGTTLLQCILSASRDAFSLPETHFFSYVLPAVDAMPSTALTADLLRSVRAAFEADSDLPSLGPLWPTLEARVGAEALSLLDVFLAIVEHYRTGPGARLIEKTPRHVLHLEQIGACFPDAAFVNVIREPIDVASSLLGVPFETSRSVLSISQRWTESVLAATAYEGRAPGRLHSVRYEDLVRAPEDTVRRVCAFVGLEYTPAMLKEFGRQAARNVGRSETWKREVGQGVLLDRQGMWRKRMTPGQAWLVAQATRSLRREFGYSELPVATRGSIASASLAEAAIRFSEARPSNGLIGATRHAGSVLKALAPA
jgi:Sulfotransferase family